MSPESSFSGKPIKYVIHVIEVISRSCHCVKSVRMWSFSGLYFPAFGLNADQKNFEYGHFSRSVHVRIHRYQYSQKNNPQNNVKEQPKHNGNKKVCPL